MAKKAFAFEDNSKKIKREIFDTSEAGMESALLAVEGQAKLLAAVGATGEMRDKIGHSITKEGSNRLSGQVGTNVEHAIYVEFGTGEFAENGAGRKGGWAYQDPSGEWFFTYGQAPQPFLRPAFRMSKKSVEQILGQKLASAFKGK
ncbi:HK97 gp10 family phage protein [Virgibacillus sp. M23]|uniref:HK97-gp10 family putative phage morphogenesis protein n=1 Tax=Virgibacillus sp. M23 TaxID=3079030 RepID=UPI002A91B51A|nr:HK97-gp10 family putative phage morphogenesis protein [Virgibacillus sp. M23]MDY7044428.1 HK97 gp10 family phage protein [Virgibacillus sp. M23]